MKKIIVALLVMVVCASTTMAQEWQTDINVAKEIASKESKPIILVFQGSDWCAPCIKLDREIWSTDTFKKYAKENYIMLKADFPRSKKNALSEVQTKANALLAEKYNKQGFFPFVVVLDSNGKVLGESSYKKTTPENYIKELNAFTK
ncbi:thioredoxin family protein [Xanthomarina sp.]|jgi:thioredoxin-related protein|uniref:thioredoxin family protein n=1 Tax=Xanthomarina sp. TaxID=1931211 RepID=UPI000C38EF32|nr:thioredoxin family protein [Xanthomarina sp.]MAL21666.1 thiol-disulfide isomerase [Xanthomarina sp.]HAB26921.1 thioredoxin family protein [Xanthomarina gelatinilytica]|tara:strand:+ start:302 stop:742 length:441 start_codon:yes stop_codon:yes gene_type:complete